MYRQHMYTNLSITPQTLCVHIYMFTLVIMSYLCVLAGKGCDEGCDGGPTADQQ